MSRVARRAAVRTSGVRDEAQSVHPASTVIPVLIYPDVREAVAWLGAAFGFVERVRIATATVVKVLLALGLAALLFSSFSVM